MIFPSRVDQPTGPGTTLRAVTKKLQIEKTLLGVDAVLNQELVGSDLSEEGILKLLEKHENAKIWITPVGGNGFIFGRGNKQFTLDVIKKVGVENITVIGDRAKISKLENLRVDTSDRELDKTLQGSTEVVTGYKEGMIMEVKS